MGAEENVGWKNEIPDGWASGYTYQYSRDSIPSAARGVPLPATFGGRGGGGKKSQRMAAQEVCYTLHLVSCSMLFLLSSGLRLSDGCDRMLAAQIMKGAQAVQELKPRRSGSHGTNCQRVATHATFRPLRASSSRVATVAGWVSRLGSTLSARPGDQNIQQCKTTECLSVQLRQERPQRRCRFDAIHSWRLCRRG